MDISHKQLRAFAEVAGTSSFTAAARNLNLTQSAISMLVRQLERETGLFLFDRMQRRVVLTEAGREMLPTAQRILADLRQIREGAADLKALRRGVLRIAAPQTIACSLLPALASRYIRQHPDISLQILDTSGDAVTATIVNDEAEIGIGPDRPIPAQMTAQLLWEEPIDIVVPAASPHLHEQPFSWAALADQNWIQYSDDFALYLQRSILAGLPVGIARASVVRQLNTALALVGQGLGVTAAPRYARVFEPLFPVRFTAPPSPSLNRKFYLYWRKGHTLSPAAQAFVSTLTDSLDFLDTMRAGKHPS